MDCTYAQSEAARKRHHLKPSWFKWHVVWAAVDVRNEALYSVRHALNLPWLAIVDLADMPEVWRRARYYGRISNPAATPLYSLHCLNEEAQDWLA